MVVVQAEQSHGDFCLICVHIDTWDACFPTSMITQGVQLIVAARDCMACRMESRHQKFQKCGGSQHSEVQMCLQSCKRRREVMRLWASAKRSSWKPGRN